MTTKVKNTLNISYLSYLEYEVKLCSLDMNSYVQQKSFLFTFLHKISTFYKYKFNVFLCININLVIILHVSIKVKNKDH